MNDVFPDFISHFFCLFPIVYSNSASLNSFQYLPLRTWRAKYDRGSTKLSILHFVAAQTVGNWIPQLHERGLKDAYCIPKEGLPNGMKSFTLSIHIVVGEIC